MKMLKSRLTQLALSALLAFTASIHAAELAKHFAQPGGSTVKIEGTSTIHDWTMEGHLIGGVFEVDPAVSFDPAQEKIAGANGGKVEAKAQTVILVRSLHSGISPATAATAMDGVMQQAMNEPQNPKITYKLTELKVAEGHKANAPFEFESTGDLTVNGVTKKVVFPVTIAPAGEGKLKIEGKTQMKMTDFKVTPPRPKLGLGLVRTADEITVTFNWLVKKAN